MKRGPKETRKDVCKRKISSMKDKNGERIAGREEILNICKTYYEELYDKSVQDPDHLLSSSPDNTEVPPCTEEEVEASLKKMSNRKAPRPDDITSDMFILGGKPVLKYLTKTFNEILTTTQIPPTRDEAKVIIIYKKGDIKKITDQSASCLIPTNYLHGSYKQEWEAFWIRTNQETKQGSDASFQPSITFIL